MKKLRCPHCGNEHEFGIDLFSTKEIATELGIRGKAKLSQEKLKEIGRRLAESRKKK